MVKSELQEVENKPQELEFPVLMKHKECKFVVLFIADKIGTVVSNGSGTIWPIGKYETRWESLDSGKWEKLQGSIVLSNG